MSQTPPTSGRSRKSRVKGTPVPGDAVRLDMARPEKRPDLDPARIAAGLLIERARLAANLHAANIGRDGVVCLIQVPAPGWTDPVRDEWRHHFRDGMRATEGEYLLDASGRGWVTWLPHKSPGAEVMAQSADTFASAIGGGRHCLGVAADLTWLPPDLVQTADYRLVLPLLTGIDVVAVAVALCGGNVTWTFDDRDATAVTPRLLRLARRPDQSAVAYLRKVEDLVTRDRAAEDVVRGAALTPRAEPTLDRLHGMAEAVAWGRGVARDLQALRAGLVGTEALDPGCLLSGPPGTGKTLFARALAASCKVPLVTGSYSQWHGSGGAHQGDLLKAMRRTFADARAKAPCILFLDEIDSFPNRAAIRHEYVDWESQVVNGLLAEVDGVEGRPGVILLAACNHPDRLDPALVRSGRLDRHIRIDLPDEAALERILREHLGDDLPGVPLSAVALLAAGSTGADCERFVRGARRRARDANRPMIPEDLVAQVGSTEAVSADDLQRAAVHEAGHAVATAVLAPGALRSVTLRGSATAGGSTAAWSSGPYLLAEDVRRYLVRALAGRAAEEVILGQPSSGAGGTHDSDLAWATHLAASAVTAFGLDEAAGLTWVGLPERATLPDVLVANRALAGRVGTVMADAYAETLVLVRAHQGAVEAVATALADKRALDGADVALLVTQHVVGA